MKESSFAGKVRQPAHLSGTLGCLALPVSAAYEADWATVSALLDYSSHTYTETWDDATCKTLMKGAYLGNGDFGAHLGGTIHSLKYYLGENGFHAGNDVTAGKWTQHIMNLAILTVERYPKSVEAVSRPRELLKPSTTC